MTRVWLAARSVDEILQHRVDAVSSEALGTAEPIVRDVRSRGDVALREYAERFGEVGPDDPLFIVGPGLARALDALSPDDRRLLGATAERIRAFADAQRGALTNITVPVEGGHAGHTAQPVERAGCYAPGGRYPLPSSVLMTALTAKAAGVASVWVASPQPTPVTLAAAAMAGVEGVIAAGGAHAGAALAYGAGPVPPSDVIVGPGNRYVTAAKYLVSRSVRIDQFAGPSELLVLADDTANPALVAADLLAQAEHDPDALPVLVTTSPSLVERVRHEIDQQLAELPTADVARAALRNGGVVLVASQTEAVAACDRIAPEHLEVMTRNAKDTAGKLQHYGALFIGEGAAEVLGDYGVGPNHVLPTGGSARATGGLSVLTFLRVRTWLEIDDLENARPAAERAMWLGRLEGLEAHARSAERRLSHRRVTG